MSMSVNERFVCYEENKEEMLSQTGTNFPISFA